MYKKNENIINSYLYNNLNTHKDIIHTPEETDTIYTNNKLYSYNYINSIINKKIKNHIHSTNTIKKTYLINKFCPITYINVINFLFIKFIIFNSIPVI